MPVTTVKKLPRAKTPEEAGVSSAAVSNMLREIEESGAEEHGFMIIRHGKVAAESFRSPYSADAPHIMYSASKAVTATAIGFAVNERLLSLETKVIDIFPEFRRKKTDDKLEKLTVKHLVTMQGGKNPSPLSNKTKDRWLNHFFDAKWEFEPGESWRYVNENIFLLCEILVRMTGMSVVSYLSPRLWEPLGIDTPFWETDPQGTEAGGWGLFLSAESLAKFALCYLQGGVFEGKQVIPAWWAEEAVLNHKNLKPNQKPNHEEGYGYCFWREGGDKKSYRAEGIFSEIGLVFEDHDAVIVTIGGEMRAGKTHDYIFHNFPKGFIKEDPSAQTNETLTKALNSRVLKPFPAAPRSRLEENINGKSIKFRKNILLNIVGFPMSVLPLAATYMTKDRAGNINNIRFRFKNDECEFTWSEGDETNTVLCGMDGEYRKTRIRLATTDYTAYSSASWRDENTLDVMIIPIESMGRRMLEFQFEGSKVRMKPTTSPDLSVMIDGIAGGVHEYVKNKTLIKLAQKALIKVEMILEPVHKGTVKNK